MTRVFRTSPFSEPQYFRRSSRSNGHHPLGQERALHLGVPYHADTPPRHHSDRNDFSGAREVSRDQLHAHANRRRVQVACGRCRKRKIRCSGDNGDGTPCTNCRSAGEATLRECRFLRVSSADVNEILPPNGYRCDPTLPTPTTHMNQTGYTFCFPPATPANLSLSHPLNSQIRLSSDSASYRPTYSSPNTFSDLHGEENLETWSYPVEGSQQFTAMSPPDSFRGWTTSGIQSRDSPSNNLLAGTYLQSRQCSMPYLNSSMNSRMPSTMVPFPPPFQTQDYPGFDIPQVSDGRTLPHLGHLRSPRRGSLLPALNTANSDQPEALNLLFTPSDRDPSSAGRSSIDQRAYSNASTALSSASGSLSASLSNVPSSFASEASSSSSFITPSSACEEPSPRSCAMERANTETSPSTAPTPTSSSDAQEPIATAPTQNLYTYSAATNYRGASGSVSALSNGEPYHPLHERPIGDATTIQEKSQHPSLDQNARMGISTPITAAFQDV